MKRRKTRIRNLRKNKRKNKTKKWGGGASIDEKITQYYLYSYFLLLYFVHTNTDDILDDPHDSHKTSIRKMKNYNSNIIFVLKFLNEKDFNLNIEDNDADSSDLNFINKTLDSVLSSINNYDSDAKKARPGFGHDMRLRKYGNQIFDYLKSFTKEIYNHLSKNQIEKIENLEWDEVKTVFENFQ